MCVCTYLYVCLYVCLDYCSFEPSDTLPFTSVYCKSDNVCLNKKCDAGNINVNTSKKSLLL